MSVPCYVGKTIDDVMRSVIDDILSFGDRIHPSKGPARELMGALLEIEDPRARLSRTETRGKPYSCIGELCWYLAKSNDLDFISYYIRAYKEFANDGTIAGGYGPRLFNWRGMNQIANVTGILGRKPDSRQAVIQLFDAQDIAVQKNDTPCTCTLQFMIRSGKLHLLANMRSNDVFWGLPHDIFCFTMLQEIVARELSLEIGIYKHFAGSLHLYEKTVPTAKRYLEEGWQSTETPMPPMPLGNPWPSIALLLNAEASIRLSSKFDECRLEGVDPYWADLIRLLQIFGYSKVKDGGKIVELRGKMSSNVYLPFIDKRLGRYL